ncbi:MAG: hypothetical protein JNK12_18575 [Acidimicrobiales bacterium]|nr:hypothetical protein [Acidimicrobiales bacterium]
MKPHRWPALLVIPAALVGYVVLDRAQEDTAPVVDGRDVTQTLEEQGLMPVAAPDTALGATWYCAGGVVGDDAEHLVIVANPTDRDLTGTITVYGDADSANPVLPEPTVATTTTAPPTDGEDGEDEATTTTAPPTTTTTVPVTTTTEVPPPAPVSAPVDVAAHSSVEVDLGDIDGVQPGFTAALVELNGGEVVVEHRVSDDDGTDVSPCSSTASPTWYFAAGATTKDAVETLVFFNPFPDDAVVDVSFRTDQDLRTPEQFEGLVIPGQSVIARDVGEVVTRREHVSASVVARSGRVVVDRIQSFDGSEGVQGLTVTLGAPVPAEAWFFPEGTVGEGVDERIVVYNPTDQRAEVDLEIIVDDPELTGEIEPFELTVPPEGYEEILLNEEARITSARGGEGALRHATVVRSVNGVPVVAERQSIGGPDSEFAGVDLVLGAPLLADEVIVAAGTSGDATQALMVFNPESDAGATVTVSALVGGEVAAVDGLDGLTVPAGQRISVVVDGVDDGTPLVVSSDQPVVVERRLVFDGDVSSAIAVPVAGSLFEPGG